MTPLLSSEWVRGIKTKKFGDRGYSRGLLADDQYQALEIQKKSPYAS